MSDKKLLQDLTIIELKKVLKEMKLPISRNKAELRTRILAADPDDHRLERICENMEEAANMSDEAGDNSPLPDSDAVRSNQSEGMSSHNVSYELELLRRERLLLQREIDIIRQENERLKNASPQAREVDQSRSPSMNIKVISELLNEYSRADQDFIKWETQIHLLKDTYALSDNLVKILIGLRLKGKALAWFHSKPELLSMAASDILHELKVMYNHRPSKIDLRKQFEARTWQSGETFHDYYHEKILKANRVPIPEDEILDYVIDGISDLHLRNQARMQNFMSTKNLLRAFEKITIRPNFKSQLKMTGDKNEVKVKDSKLSTMEETRSKGNRCYNCNQPGHIASECKRSRREKGSCYSYGEFGHAIKDCLKKATLVETKEISNVDIIPEDHNF